MSGGSRNSRSDKAREASKRVSIAEIVVSTAEELLGKSEKEVGNFLKTTDTYQKIFGKRENSNDYYKNEIESIIADFIEECRYKNGWERIK